MTKFKNKFQNYINDGLALVAALPLIIISYGFILAILALPVLFAIWLIKEILF